MVEQQRLLDEKNTKKNAEEENERDSIIKNIIKWMKTHIKFLLIPGYVSEELSERQREYEKTKSKRKFISRLMTPLTILGMIIIFIVVSFAIFAPWISPYTFYELTTTQTGAWNPPSPAHPLGQTHMGHDILGRLIFGARTSLFVALPSIIVAVIGGMILGIISGYFGGWIDSTIMRIMDIFLSFPSLLLIMFFIAVFGRELQYFILAYGILGMAGYARLIRGQVLKTKNLEFVDAARVAGSSNFRIMFKHILPNCIQPVIVAFTFDIGGIILSLAGLAFLGFTSASQTIEWGYDIDKARLHLYDAPWAAFWPGIMIMITVLGFMLLGDGLRDALDPKIKNL